MFCSVLDLIMVTGDGGLTGAPACTHGALRPGKQGGGPDLSQDNRQLTNTKNLSLEDDQMGKYRGWV